MPSIFNQALLPAPKRNLFDLSSGLDTTLDPGWIVPYDIRELLPGDTFKVNTAHKIRTLPLKAPAFQAFDVSWFTFVVPMRLLMNHKKWEKFIAEEEDAEPPAYIKYKNLAEKGFHFDDSYVGVESQSLANYLGIPQHEILDPEAVEISEEPISLAPFLAYQLIYNEWFRDENIYTYNMYDYFLEMFGDGGDCSAIADDPDLMGVIGDLTRLQHRAFKKDVFTSALPSTQHGTQVTIPLGPGLTKIPVQNVAPHFRFFNGSEEDYDLFGYGTDTPLFASYNNKADIIEAKKSFTADSISLMRSAQEPRELTDPTQIGVQLQLGDGTGVFVNLANIGAIEVNQFRTAMMMQTFFERLETCGSRYTEVIRGMFGVFTPDARLQRPELISSYKSSIMIGDVLQHDYNEDSPAGNLTGLGLGVGDGVRWTYRAYEHCLVMSIVSILPKQSYSQGLPKYFSRLNRYEYFWPLLAHQGEEAVKVKELRFDGQDDMHNNDTFGYQSRYYDYRSAISRISGELSPWLSLGYWTGSRQFDNAPTLSSQFIECRFSDSGLDRIFPLEYFPGKNQGFFLASIWSKVKAYRPVPRFATPATL